MTPLTGPHFGSYAADDVRWLLTDLSNVALEAPTEEREWAIQHKQAHYAESLPFEYQPDATYRELFAAVLAQTSARLATAVGVVTELVLAERGTDVILVSLARAGTPIGILVRRWALRRRGLDLPHYAVSIVRDRGIDFAALDYLAEHHDPSGIVFIDGWTGKGAITKELSEALVEYERTTGIRFNPDLAVLADPGTCARTFGTRDDFLIASACLNSTVSGLVSRTVLNARLMSPGRFHGAKFYRELADEDQSETFLDSVAAQFDFVCVAVADELAAVTAADRTPTWAGQDTVEQIQKQYGIASPNFVKPGIGETTRVLLRRIPWLILLRDMTSEEHRHIRMLATARGVPVVEDPSLAYASVGLIKDVTE